MALRPAGRPGAGPPHTPHALAGTPRGLLRVALDSGVLGLDGSVWKQGAEGRQQGQQQERRRGRQHWRHRRGRAGAAATGELMAAGSPSRVSWRRLAVCRCRMPMPPPRQPEGFMPIMDAIETLTARMLRSGNDAEALGTPRWQLGRPPVNARPLLDWELSTTASAPLLPQQ